MISPSVFSTVILFSGLAMAHPSASPCRVLSEKSFAQFRSYPNRLMAELKKRLFDDALSSASSSNLVSLRRRGVDKAVVGAAVGGVLGGLFLIALLVVLFWFLRRRRGHRHSQDGEPETPPEAVSVRTPFMADHPDLPHGTHGGTSEKSREATTQASSDGAARAQGGLRSKSSHEIDPRSLQESLQGIPTEYTTGLGLYQKDQEEPLRVELEGSSEFRDQVGSLRPPSRIKTGQRQFIAGFKRTMSFRRAE
ncbi:unnamed protein product [Clonostachys rosea f. rosea IK726]|uniref:Transmembrane protein n=2 Tax=Bionectria ochroleuca TaxID=29856 RepID=A0A0B7KA63_BIOOC|nr:unnamed protein product [Clonostachys rosea f. rosea IK726]